MTAAVWAKSSLGNAWAWPGGDRRFRAIAAADEVKFGLFLGRAEARNLVLGPKPAHEAARFLFRAFLVERHEAREDVFVGKIDRPAVGLGDGGVELVVKLLQDQHEAVVEDALFVLG